MRDSSITDDTMIDAMRLAMFVRNAIEGLHHQGHLSDEVIPRLNSLVRDAIYTGMLAMDAASFEQDAKSIIGMIDLLTPEYWEAPQILPEFAAKIQRPPPPFSTPAS